MIKWESIKPIYQQRILLLAREYSLYIKQMTEHQNIVDTLSKNMLDKVEIQKVVTNEKEMHWQEKYIQLDKIAETVYHIAEKQDAVCEQANLLTKALGQQTKLLYEAFQEEYPLYSQDDIIDLLYSKINN